MEKLEYNSDNVGYKKSNKLYDKILRQELESFTPNCNLKCAMICNFILMLLFLTFGIPIVALSNSIIEYEYDYTEW